VELCAADHPVLSESSSGRARPWGVFLTAFAAIGLLLLLAMLTAALVLTAQNHSILSRLATTLAEPTQTDASAPAPLVADPTGLQGFWANSGALYVVLWLGSIVLAGS